MACDGEGAYVEVGAYERLVAALERIAWHELTWQEARDVARIALADGSMRLGPQSEGRSDG